MQDGRSGIRFSVVGYHAGNVVGSAPLTSWKPSVKAHDHITLPDVSLSSHLASRASRASHPTLRARARLAHARFSSSLIHGLLVTPCSLCSLTSALSTGFAHFARFARPSVSMQRPTTTTTPRPAAIYVRQWPSRSSSRAETGSGVVCACFGTPCVVAPRQAGVYGRGGGARA